MHGDGWIDQVAAQCAQPRQRAILISAGEPAVNPSRATICAPLSLPTGPSPVYLSCMSNRDEFSKRTKNNLALRACYLCSLRGCQKITVGPSDESDSRTTNIGVAAHICAASKGGPRYVENMTQAERRHITNGIWLCSDHAALIDRDKAKYTIDILRAMKREHEAAIQENVRSGARIIVSVGDLIAFGPEIVCTGMVREVDGSSWTLSLKHFVKGDLSAVAALVGRFKTLPAHDRYVLVNELNDGRVLTTSPTLTASGDGYFVRCPVAPGFPRIAARQLGTQLAIPPEKMDLSLDPRTRQIARVSGVDSLPQVIRQTLSLQRSEMMWDRDYGAELVSYFDEFRDSPWLEHLLKLEVIRLAAIPHTSVMPPNSESTPLQCVERVYGIELLSDTPTNDWLPIRVDFDVKGIGRWQHDLAILMPSVETQAKIRERQENFERLFRGNPIQ